MKFLIFALLVSLAASQLPVPRPGPVSPGILAPVPLPAMIPGIVNPSINPFITGPLNGLLSNPVFNLGLLVPSPLLPFGRRAGVGKRQVVPPPPPPPPQPPMPMPVPGPFPLSPLVRPPGPYIPNYAPRFAPPLFNPFLNPAVNPAIPGMFNTLLQGNIMGGIFGKRSSDDEIANRTLCKYTNTPKPFLSCVGQIKSECEVTPILTALKGVSITRSNLTIVPEEVNGVQVYRIVSLSLSELPSKKVTLVHPSSHENVLVSIFHSPKITDQGLLIEDSKCWNNFVSLMKDQTPEDIRFSLMLKIF